MSDSTTSSSRLANNIFLEFFTRAALIRANLARAAAAFLAALAMSALIALSTRSCVAVSPVQQRHQFSASHSTKIRNFDCTEFVPTFRSWQQISGIGTAPHGCSGRTAKTESTVHCDSIASHFCGVSTICTVGGSSHAATAAAATGSSTKHELCA